MAASRYVKPILAVSTSGSNSSATASVSSSSSSSSHELKASPAVAGARRHTRSRSVQWDEQNLAVNESEKVPRMKITEPKTPYRYDTDSSPSREPSSFLTADNANMIASAALARRDGWNDGTDDDDHHDAKSGMHAADSDNEESPMDDSIAEAVGRSLSMTEATAPLTIDQRAKEEVKRHQFEVARKNHYKMQEGRLDIRSLLKSKAAAAANSGGHHSSDDDDDVASTRHNNDHDHDGPTEIDEDDD